MEDLKMMNLTVNETSAFAPASQFHRHLPRQPLKGDPPDARTNARNQSLKLKSDHLGILVFLWLKQQVLKA